MAKISYINFILTIQNLLFDQNDFFSIFNFIKFFDEKIFSRLNTFTDFYFIIYANLGFDQDEHDQINFLAGLSCLLAKQFNFAFKYAQSIKGLPTVQLVNYAYVIKYLDSIKKIPSFDFLQKHIQSSQEININEYNFSTILNILHSFLISKNLIGLNLLSNIYKSKNMLDSYYKVLKFGIENMTSLSSNIFKLKLASNKNYKQYLVVSDFEDTTSYFYSICLSLERLNLNIQKRVELTVAFFEEVKHLYFNFTSYHDQIVKNLEFLVNYYIDNDQVDNLVNLYLNFFDDYNCINIEEKIKYFLLFFSKIKLKNESEKINYTKFLLFIKGRMMFSSTKKICISDDFFDKVTDKVVLPIIQKIKKECTICYENKFLVKFKNCSHNSCYECKKQISLCHLCRTEFTVKENT